MDLLISRMTSRDADKSSNESGKYLERFLVNLSKEEGENLFYDCVRNEFGMFMTNCIQKDSP